MLCVRDFPVSRRSVQRAAAEKMSSLVSFYRLFFKSTLQAPVRTEGEKKEKKFIRWLVGVYADMGVGRRNGRGRRSETELRMTCAWVDRY